jgi:signal transduction histidine kinase/ActR/RegA family two-component response regulator
MEATESNDLRLEHDLYERQCEIQLLRSVAFAANDARSVHAAMGAALELVCRHAGWPLGHVFLADAHGELFNTDIWYDEGDRFPELRLRTEAAQFGPGVGLPGHVLLQRLPVWIEDVAETHGFTPARGIAAFGLRSAVGVPILVGSDVRAVLELFRETPTPLDGHFVDLMGQVGAMLGRVIEREQSESELLEANNRLTRALYDLREAQDRVVQQERLRALGQMASGIAHDFNNALHPIVGYTELLLQNPVLAEAPTAMRCLRNILTAATDAGAVVGRLREFYRTKADGEDAVAPVDLGAVVRQVVELTRPRWYSEALAGGVRITVNTEIEPTPRILGDAPQLREAVINLVLNAVDSMPQSGTIVLRTRTEQGRVVLEVSDTGTGMTEDVRRHCLEPFFTTKGQRGSGLGLGMVYGIVQRHEGTLDITSSPGLGTTMTLTFPAIQAAEAAPAPARARQVHVEPLDILLVDDQPAALEVMQKLLEYEGHRVTTATNGVEALACLREMDADLVITDRAMPRMGGDELASFVKQLPRPVPVIMVTGFGVLMSAEELPPGVDLVLSKPLTRGDLLDAVARMQPAISSAA